MTQRTDLPPMGSHQSGVAGTAEPDGADSTGVHAVAPARGRRPARIVISVPVELRDQFGGCEQARTQSVTIRGAAIATTLKLRVGHKLTVHNLKSGRNAECHVIGIEPVVKEVHQVEVEFTRSQPDFWPVQFPTEDSTGLPAEVKPDVAPRTSLASQTLSAKPLSSNAAPPHDEQLVVLADAFAENFAAPPIARSQERFVPRPASVDSVAQFRAANRAAHRREQRMKTFFSAVFVLVLAGAVFGGRRYLQHRAEVAPSESAPAVQSAMPKSESRPPSISPASPAPVSLPATPPLKTSAADSPSAAQESVPLEEPVVMPAEKKPAETQISVRHRAAIASSRGSGEDSGEAPIALPLHNPAGDGSDKPILSAVVSGAPAKTAVLAPQAAKIAVPAKLIHTVPAQYPAMARQLHAEGQVVVNVDVDSAGNVSGARALSGAPLLRSAALDAVRRWKYEPATLGGKAIASTQTVKVDFRWK